MPAHDLSRAEFEIVDVEHEGLAPQHRGITSISGVHPALLKSARDADAPDIGKVGALAKLQLHDFLPTKFAKCYCAPNKLPGLTFRR